MWLVTVLVLTMLHLRVQNAGNSLVVLAPRYFSSQVSLLVVQVLQLQVQRVDFLTSLAGFLLGASHAEDGFAVQATEICEVSVEFLLLCREL